MAKTPLKSTESQLLFPNMLYDFDKNTTYWRGQFLGMGSFGHCFLVKEEASGKSYAVKIIENCLLTHPLHSYLLKEEMKIHKHLRHKNIVTFFQEFANEQFTFIILELCINGTLMELQRRRHSVTLIEAKYFIFHIMNGVNYLHKRHIVHGDLKLSNIFLSNRMMVKIGDFGLATALSFEGEQIKMQCGTPNYMAPEIVEKKEHSYGGDVWAIGCILYGLLVGKLPFQSCKDHLTYDKITKCDYSVYVPGLRKQVSAYIRKIFQKTPENRPSITELKNDEFMQGFIPRSLPEYTMWEPPQPTDLIGRRSSMLKLSSSISRYKSSFRMNRKKRTKRSLTRLRYSNKPLVAI